MGTFRKLKALKIWVTENPASILLVAFLLIIFVFTISVDIQTSRTIPSHADLSADQKPEVVIQ